METFNMTGLAVSEKTMARLNKIADDKGISTRQLAEQAIRQFLRDEVRQILQRETEAFRSLYPELLEKYSDQFVAIYQGRIIDWDKDQFALFLRVDQKYPDTPVLIKQVLPEPEEIYTFRSPRISRV
jgi:hypothetical protein